MDVFSVTRDRTENQLMKNERRMDAQRDWQVSGPLVVAIVLTLVTADFRDHWGIPKADWYGLFLVGAVLAGAHCLYSFIKWCCNRPLSPDRLADRILQPPT